MTFAERVYEVLRKVPKGKVTTYKILGDLLNTKAYQAIGQALKNNPYAPEVPCHRVVRQNGSIGGFMGKISGESVKKKISLLRSEGVYIEGNKVSNFEMVRWSND